MMNQTLLIDKPTEITNYRARVMSCWLGKAIGGTLGMPFEGHHGPLDLTFYSPVPTEMLPNDDLDLQVVWACVLDKLDHVRVDRHILAKAWLDHVEFPWDEYGVAIRNLKNGLKAPQSGSYDNWFTHSMGAPIRSELWACLAPGDPELAAAFAYEDACVDHGGEGIWAEVFLAALQSAAFAENHVPTLLRDALNFLPETSRTRRAVEDTQLWWTQTRDWQAVRDRVLAAHGCDNFTDAPMNLAFTVLGWLAGEGDFSRTICIAVNCGMDTDCTGASVGALMGILDPDCIPAKWIAPIGRSLVLSPGIVNLDAPDSLDEFTDMVINLRDRLESKLPNSSSSEQSVDQFQVEINYEFTDEMPPTASEPLLCNTRRKTLPGTVGCLQTAQFEDDVLVMRYSFELPSDRTVRVMFNTPEESKVWVDGQYAFGRKGGVMSPSFHRAPADQFIDLNLTAGKHSMVAAVRKPSTRSQAEWVAGIGDATTYQWLLEGFNGPAV